MKNHICTPSHACSPAPKVSVNLFCKPHGVTHLDCKYLPHVLYYSETKAVCFRAYSSLHWTHYIFRTQTNMYICTLLCTTIHIYIYIRIHRERLGRGVHEDIICVSVSRPGSEKKNLLHLRANCGNGFHMQRVKNKERMHPWLISFSPFGHLLYYAGT